MDLASEAICGQRWPRRDRPLRHRDARVESALKTMNGLDLPDDLKDAGESARNCAATPPTTR
ncbi:hypothetical protein [Actinokineospora sp.]|uniref:hypothetical protein n=1 Tax=Actinokineospora sp. TaxID=1872133 RepID=UPI00403801E5